MVSSSFSFTIFSSICLHTDARISSNSSLPCPGSWSMAVTAKKLEAVSEPKKALRLMGRFTPIWRPFRPSSSYTLEMDQIRQAVRYFVILTPILRLTALSSPVSAYPWTTLSPPKGIYLPVRRSAGREL